MCVLPEGSFTAVADCIQYEKGYSFQ